MRVQNVPWRSGNRNSRRESAARFSCVARTQMRWSQRYWRTWCVWKQIVLHFCFVTNGLTSISAIAIPGSSWRLLFWQHTQCENHTCFVQWCPWLIDSWRQDPLADKSGFSLGRLPLSDVRWYLPQHDLKKPNSTYFPRRNDKRPFEDETSLEFLCEKNEGAVPQNV